MSKNISMDAADEPTTLEAVLAYHHRGDWSDRTFSCLGCYRRGEAEIEAKLTEDYREKNIPVDPVVLQEARSTLTRLSHPGWPLETYYRHLADAVREWQEKEVSP